MWIYVLLGIKGLRELYDAVHAGKHNSYFVTLYNAYGFSENKQR